MASPETVYTSEFYRRQADDSERSAGAVLEVLFGLTRPRSILDIGCGVGAWLSAARKLGVEDILGVDGHTMPAEAMRIPPACYRRIDLSMDMPKIERSFDLAMSLEVAEHLPGGRAEALVEALTAAAGIVLFSAAIPFQGGRNHVNEQLPSYWIPLFQRRGFRCFDVIRPRIWDDRRVDVWYRQNILLFSARESFGEELPTPAAYDRIHPEVWLDPKMPMRRLRRSVKSRLRGLVTDRR